MSDFNIEEVKAAIISGLEAEADDDAIRLQMFKLGVSFNKINAIFKETAIEGGFRADPKVVKEAIGVELGDEAGDYSTWDDVTEAAADVVASVEGATEGQVIAAMKRMANEAEVEFPVKPKAGPRNAGSSKIKSNLVDLVNATPEIGATDLLHAIIGEVTGDFRVRNSIEYVNMYLPVMIAARLGCPLSEVKLEGFDKPALEAQYGGTTSYTKPADDVDEESEAA